MYKRDRIKKEWHVDKPVSQDRWWWFWCLVIAAGCIRLAWWVL